MKRNIGSQIEFKREHKLLYIGYQLFPDLEMKKKEKRKKKQAMKSLQEIAEL